jgi:hypothetical protein
MGHYDLNNLYVEQLHYPYRHRFRTQDVFE